MELVITDASTSKPITSGCCYWISSIVTTCYYTYVYTFSHCWSIIDITFFVILGLAGTFIRRLIPNTPHPSIAYFDDILFSQGTVNLSFNSIEEITMKMTISISSTSLLTFLFFVCSRSVCSTSSVSALSREDPHDVWVPDNRRSIHLIFSFSIFSPFFILILSSFHVVYYPFVPLFLLLSILLQGPARRKISSLEALFTDCEHMFAV